MHPSAKYYAKLFFETYISNAGEARLLDIGSQDVNGSLREVAPAGIEYIGVDMEEGEGVNIVLTDPYSLPFPDESFDVAVSSSCFEHSEFFWIAFTEALRVLKPHGLLYINVPSNGKFHRYPIDCWRFYPDSGRALANWARRCGFQTQLLESFVGVQLDDVWNDFVAVFLKDEAQVSRYPFRLIEKIRDFENGELYGSAAILHLTEFPEDMRLNASLRTEVAQKVEMFSRALEDLKQKSHEALAKQQQQSHNALAEKQSVIAKLLDHLAASQEKLGGANERLAQEEHNNFELRTVLAAEQAAAVTSQNEVDQLRKRYGKISRSFAWRFSDGLIHAPRTVGRWLRWPFFRLAFHKSGRPRGWFRRLGWTKQPTVDAFSEQPDQLARPEQATRPVWTERPTPIVGPQQATISPLFDRSYYMERYSDVVKLGADPYSDFVHYGWREGRDPNEFFDVSWYLERNIEVREAGINPLKHYIERGWKEGRDPGPKFSVKAYLERYRDVRDAGREPLEHYLRHGKSEGRHLGDSYGDWIDKYDTLDDRTRLSMHERIAGFALQPKISVVMPVYNTDLRWLREAIESVRAQIYPRWELCISDDASTLPGVTELVREYADKDNRIRLVFRATNGHISANSNSALSAATGEFIALMDADDLIPEDALYWVAEEINAYPSADLIFSDEDKVDLEGQRYEPYFKPDWNPALMLSENAFSHLGVYRHSLVKEVGGFRLGFEGSQDHDLVLRCADATVPSKIRHIPHILYHWRAGPESTASSSEAKPYAWNAGAQAIEEHLARNGVKGHVTRVQNMFYQVSFEPPAEWPKVSVVMPSGCKPELLRPCLNELLARTTYPNFEVLLAVNEIRFQSEEQAACLQEYAKDPRVRVLAYEDREFNFSWVVNWAAKQASGAILCLMNDDIKLITADWLEKFVARLQLDRVGAVGAMLYYPDDTIQHAGVILGMHGVAGHVFRGMARGSHGYFGRAELEQDLSCVTAACVAVRREAFEVLNGMDERIAIAFNDVDFCIRLREKGWRIIWTPEVEHYHLESQTIGHHASDEREQFFQEEVRMMREQWGTILDSDPFFNPNLSLQDDKMVLAFPPRVAKDVLAS